MVEPTLRSIALGIFVVTTLVSARAETVDPNNGQVWTQCRSPTDPEYVSAQNLPGCTALIESGQLGPLDRARAFAYRAMARSDLNQFEQVVADFVQAHQVYGEILSRLHIVPSMRIVATRRCDRFLPDEAYLKRQTGEVAVGYDVGKRGEINNVHVVKSSGRPPVDQAAVTCASTQWRNTPARIDDIPLVWPGIKSMVSFEIHE